MPDQPNELSTEHRVAISIPLEGGVVRWADVGEAIAVQLTLDPESVQQLLPVGTLDLNRPAAALALMGINLALGDAVGLKVERDDAGKSHLKVVCDDRLKSHLRVKRESKISTVAMDQDAAKFDVKRPLVLFLHGMRSDSQGFDDVREYMRSKGFPTGAADYDDQQGIADSAKQLAHAYNDWRRANHSKRSVCFVGHSMGGLIAREWMENDALTDPAFIGLITVATPHRGSNWASMPPLLELFAEGRVKVSGFVDILLHQPSSQGMNDLIPGSEFLTTLNERARRERVQYTTVMGTGGPIAENQAETARQTLEELSQRDGFLKAIGPRIKPLLGSFDEVIHGRGDGVVALSNASIDGVKDVVVIEVAHTDFFYSPSSPGLPETWKVIEDRLAKLAENAK